MFKAGHPRHDPNPVLCTHPAPKGCLTKTTIYPNPSKSQAPNRVASPGLSHTQPPTGSYHIVFTTQVPRTARKRVALIAAFIDAALRYWLTVFPLVCRDVRRLHARAAQISDPALRELALDALSKRGNIEGAVVFAAFVPRTHRAAVVRALAAFQAAYNYADMLAEQPNADPIANGRRLHEALLSALDDPAAPHLDYYAYLVRREESGYLEELIDACRAALSTLPSYPSVAMAARRAAERIVAFQSRNLSKAQGNHSELERWAHDATPPGTELRWWETAASAGSSLGVYVLIAAAADPSVDPEHVAAIENVYFPWIGALHSLLDNLVDTQEDHDTGQRSLVGYYASPEDTAARLGALAVQSMRRAEALPRGRRHAIILAGMAGSYLSVSDPSAPGPRLVSQSVLDAMGELAGPTMFVFKARGLAARSSLK
jgi:tetraprenyl-beta-curcumene synthase